MICPWWMQILIFMSSRCEPGRGHRLSAGTKAHCPENFKPRNNPNHFSRCLISNCPIYFFTYHSHLLVIFSLSLCLHFGDHVPFFIPALPSRFLNPLFLLFPLAFLSFSSNRPGCCIMSKLSARVLYMKAIWIR